VFQRKLQLVKCELIFVDEKMQKCKQIRRRSFLPEEFAVCFLYRFQCVNMPFYNAIRQLAGFLKQQSQRMRKRVVPKQTFEVTFLLEFPNPFHFSSVSLSLHVCEGTLQPLQLQH